MLRSLYSAVAGLGAHRTKMDVIGNNIANVNTVGFKADRANFQDMLYQMEKAPSAVNNPSQVGTGMKVSSISRNMNGGGLQNTGRTLDLAIQGSGMFILKDDPTAANANTYYTRDGVFFLTHDGYLVNSDGYYVCNENGDVISGLTGVNTIAINAQGEIFINGGTTATATIGIATFANYEGLQKEGNNLYSETVASGTANHGTATDAGAKIASGYLEMSNVDLTNEFTDMITTQRGFQANARVITVSDTLLEELVNLKR